MRRFDRKQLEFGGESGDTDASCGCDRSCDTAGEARIEALGAANQLGEEAEGRLVEEAEEGSGTGRRGYNGS